MSRKKAKTEYQKYKSIFRKLDNELAKAKPGKAQGDGKSN